MVEVNLLPWRDELRRYYAWRMFFVYGLLAIFVGSIMFCLHWHFSNELLRYKTRYQKNLILTAKSNLNDATEVENTLSLGTKHQTLLTHLLQQLARGREHISMSELSAKAKEIQLKGEAATITEVRKLMSDLVVIESLEFVKLLAMEEEENKIKFQLQLMEK